MSDSDFWGRFTNTTTVNGQFRVSSVTSSSLEGLRGDVNSAVSNLANGIKELGISKNISINGAISTVKDLLGVKKFPDSWSPSPLTDGVTPQETRNTYSRGPGIMQYPDDLPAHYIRFTFKQYVQNNPLSRRTDTPEAIISLPLPLNLSEEYNINYSAKELGVLGLLEGAGGPLQDQLNKFLTDNKGSNIEDFAKAGQELGRAASTAEGAAYLARKILPTGLGQEAVERATGAVNNPYQALQFEGAALRTHSFSFRFSPSSAAESKTLKEIIKTFKIRMHPEQRLLTLNFPDLVDISLYTNNSTDEYITLKECFLQSMSVNYTPTGSPSYFKGGKDPVEVELQLTFGETRPLSRQEWTGGASNQLDPTPLSTPQTPARDSTGSTLGNSISRTVENYGEGGAGSLG